jgi:hypothetical protein
LKDQIITKIGTDIEKENATRILLEKGANSRLIMHLTGSGGSGKSFVLKHLQIGMYLQNLQYLHQEEIH